MKRFLIGLLRLLHKLMWGFVVLVILLILLFAFAAYGIPGTWVQSKLDAMVDAETGKLTVEHISYLPLRGLTIKGVALRSPEGKLMAGCSQAQLTFPLFSLESPSERLRRITIEDLYIEQPVLDDSDEPPPDFSQIDLPIMKDVQVKLVRPDICGIAAEYAMATLNMTEKNLCVTHISARLNSTGEHAEGTVEVDLNQQVVSLALRGHLYQTRLNPIWEILELETVRHYSDNFHLKAPAWGDVNIRVGLNKYHNIFQLSGDIVALGGGDYCGVPFDEASTTLTSQGVRATRTTFDAMKAYRSGTLVAEGSLLFDVGEDLFEFTARNYSLSPKECLQIIDEPFTDVIPPILAPEPPQLNIRGTLPLMTEQAPSKVILDGTLLFPSGGTVQGLKTDLLKTELKMKGGVITLRHLHAKLPTDAGEVDGTVSFVISDDADFADISAAARFVNVSLQDVISPFSRSKNIPTAKLNGFADLNCRTGEDILSSLHGDFNCTLEGELITRARIFSKLTNVIADYIPGISSLTDSSKALLVGTIDKGVVVIPDFELTGDLLSIEGSILFDLPGDTVNAELSVGNFKRGSVMGYLTRWATTPVNTFLWQIRLNGPRDNIEWEIHTLVNRLWDSTLGREASSTTTTETEEDSSGGFFSWLGFGSDDDDASQAHETPADEAPDVTDTPHIRPIEPTVPVAE